VSFLRHSSHFQRNNYNPDNPALARTQAINKRAISQIADVKKILLTEISGASGHKIFFLLVIQNLRFES